MLELWHQDSKRQVAYRAEHEPMVVELVMM